MNKAIASGALVVAGLALLYWALGQSGANSRSGLGGAIEVDGSSTVFPITEAVAEEFRKQNNDVQISVGVSGTGGGFKRFTAGETDISNASRPIKESEIETAKSAGIEYTELKVAIDGLALIVHKDNRFLSCLTTDQLKQIWQPDSNIKSWQQVNPDWPNQPIKLYGPGTDSGTFDYFTEVINGKAGASRADYTASEDDNVLVQGVAGDQYSLGYFGYAYYAENMDKLKVLAIDAGKGCVAPSDQTIEQGTYTPLSRPIYIYVKNKALSRPEMSAFVKYYLDHASTLVKEVGYIPLPSEAYDVEKAKLTKTLEMLPTD